MEDVYSPEGHPLVEVHSNLLWQPYWYCPETGKCYYAKLQEVTVEILGSFSEPEQRLDDMRDLGKLIAAKAKVTKEDLKTLGYL